MNTEREFNAVWLVALITLLVIGLCVVFFWDFVSQNVILPIYTAGIIALYGINAVQQSIYLFFLILFAGAAAVIFLGSTFSRSKLPQYSGYSKYSIEIENPYTYWHVHCRNLARNKFANDEFARVARKLLLEVLAYQEHRDVIEIESMVLREELELPVEIQHLLVSRKLLSSAKEYNWLQRQWHQLLQRFNKDIHTPTPEVLNEAETIITFLEQRLEIYHND